MLNSLNNILKIKKVYLVVTIIFLLQLITFKGTYAVLNFSDAKDIAAYAYGAVEKLTIDNIIKGYADNTFRPLSSITRAELIKIAIDAMLKYTDNKYTINLNDTENDTGFVDLNNHWSVPYIRFAKVHNIIQGMTDEKGNSIIKPDTPITRAEACKIISLVFKIKDTSLILSDDIFNNVFPDVKKTDWYFPYVKNLWINSIVNGYDDGTFGPNNYIVRQDAVAMLIGKSNNEGKLPSLSGAVKPANDEVTISAKIEQAKRISEKTAITTKESEQDKMSNNIDTSKWQVYKDTASRYTYKCPDDFTLGVNQDYGGQVKTSDCTKNYSENKFSFDDGINVSFRYVPLSISDTYELSPGKKYSKVLFEQFLSDNKDTKHYSNNGFEGFYTMKNNTTTFSLIARKSTIEGYFEVIVTCMGSTKTDVEYKNLSDAIISTFTTF